MHLGYRHATLLAPIPGFAQGARPRGHEFHYSIILAQPDPALARVLDAEGAELAEAGSRRDWINDTFLHLIAAAG